MYIIVFIFISALVLEQLGDNFLYQHTNIVDVIGNFFGSIFYIGGIVAITMAICLIYKSIKQRNFQLNKWDICFSIVLVWGLFSVLLSSDIKLTFWGTDYRIDGYFSYLIYASLYIICRSIKKSELKIWVLRALAIATTSLCLDCVLKDDIFSIFSHFNHYAYIITLGSTILAGLFILETKIIIKICYALMFITHIYCLITVDTFGCYLAVLFALIFAVFFTGSINKKYILQSLILLFLFLGISVFVNIKTQAIANNFEVLNTDIEKIATNAPDKENAGSLRIQMWTHTIKYIAKRPLFGYGPEGTTHAFLNDGLHNDRPHNEYLQYALFMGIPASIFYIAGLVFLFVFALKKRKQLSYYSIISGLAVLAYCISAFFGNTMYYTSPYFFMILGMVSKPVIEKK